jgi:hypothetical protein
MPRLSLSSACSALAAGAGAAWVVAACVDGAPLHATLPVSEGTDGGDAGGGATSSAPPKTLVGAGADASIAALPGPDPCTDVTPVAPAPYTSWNNATILGGGFVSGIQFSKAAANVLYARTDVGGAYRWNATAARWTAITDWVGADDANLMGIESIAPDPVDPDVVYVAAGEYLTTNGFILRSADQGATWVQNAINIPMGGNSDGRNVGERLAVDPALTSRLFFASRNNGLWTSADSASTWTQVTSFPTTGPASYGLSLVFIDARSPLPGGGSSTIYVGVSPSATAATSGASVYRSTDGGATWQTVPGEPMAGQFPLRAAMDNSGHLYFTYGNFSGPNSVTAGAVWQLDTSNDTWTNATPMPAGKGGFGGVSTDPSADGTVIVSTIDRWPDQVYRSTDYGASWVPLVTGVSQVVQNVNGAEWLFFGGTTLSATGWMGDIEIDPFKPGRALYNTGQGIWWSDDTGSAAPTWTFQDQGLEETVSLGLISPSGGAANLLSAVGDICGFRHADLTLPAASGMFTNPVFANTTALDFAEQHPGFVVRVGTTSAATTRHGAFSTDEGITWTPFYTEPNQTADGGTTTTSAGSIAVSADGNTLLWAPASAGRRAAAILPAISTDRSQTWTFVTGLASGAKVASDRVNPARFYATTTGTQLFASSDGGNTFTAIATLPIGGGTVRPTPGAEGDLWIATTGGLFHYTDANPTPVLSPPVASAAAIGFGRAAQCSGYPILYVAGQVNSTSGIFRSDDQATTWQQIDDPNSQFGFISYIAGDPRIYGRVYLGSGGRGILYGDP